MRKFTLLASLVMAIGCGDDGKKLDIEDGVEGSNPVVPEVALYPFPSDFYLTADSTTLTGLRVDIPSEALPEALRPTDESDLLAGADGFSRMSPLSTYMPGSFDDSNLPGVADPSSSITLDSPVLLIEEGSWELVPIIAEIDLTEPLPENRALIIRPLRLLKASSGHIVVLRDSIRTVGGTPHVANDAFRALRDNIPTKSAAIEAQRDDFALVQTALDGLEIDSSTVVQAWSFHTRSHEQVTGSLLAMQQIAKTAPMSGSYIIEGDTVEGDNRQIIGKFEVPSFIGDDGRIARDSDGKPMIVSTSMERLRLTIPSTVTEERPTILAGHGFMGGPDQGTRGYINDISRDYQMTTVGTHLGINEINAGLTANGIADPHFLLEVADDIQQNIANQTFLARFVREVLKVDMPGIFNGDDVYYMGASNGGTFGALATATSPEFERAVLIVGGGGIIHFLERAVQWHEFGALANLVYPESRERQAAFALMQLVFDSADPINYSEALAYNRYPGVKEIKIMKIIAINDTQVRNLVSEWVARTAGLPLVTPSPKDVFGLRTVSADDLSGETSAFFIFDEMVEPTPLGNIPPDEENGTHGNVRKLPEFQLQVGHFLQTGELTQACDGACDPD